MGNSRAVMFREFSGQQMHVELVMISRTIELICILPYIIQRLSLKWINADSKWNNPCDNRIWCAINEILDYIFNCLVIKWASRRADSLRMSTTQMGIFEMCRLYDCMLVYFHNSEHCYAFHGLKIECFESIDCVSEI